MSSLTLQEMLEICRPIQTLGTLPTSIGSICVDSRLISRGDVFVAVRGSAMDGHSFIQAALDAGATIVIAELPVEYEGVYSVVVSDTRALAGMLALAEYGHPEKHMTLIGVTGTNGKTTVSTLVYQVLQTLGHTCGLIGTVEKRIGERVIESHLTTPGPIELAIDLSEMAKAGCSHVVMEVSSHALDQHRTDGLSFQVACFTNLTQDHLDYHGDMVQYAASKAKLFDGLSPDSIAIVNVDSEYAESVVSLTQAQRWNISFKTGSGNRIVENNAAGIMLDMEGTIIQSPLSGDFNAYNVATAWLACIASGCSPANTAAALSSATGAAGRLERVTGPKGGPIVFVDYAHTPDALENVLKTVSKMHGSGKIITVFGCGGNRDKTKRPIMGAIAAKYADWVYVTSDNPRFEEPDDIINDIVAGMGNSVNVYREVDRPTAIMAAIDMAGIDDIVLIAGKGHETYQEIKGVRYPMDDRLIANEALSSQANDGEVA
jgi:UDP-N-acetylmuramoyl-L-alanyl-D-glutamate--2,6-diaminopimelate ligase